MGISIFCGVAQIAVHRSHKPVGGGASPPATSICCSQHRRAAGPYKPGRPGRLPGTAGFDTQDYNHMLPVARGTSGTVLRTRIAVVRLHSRVPIRANVAALNVAYPGLWNPGVTPPKGKCVSSILTRGAILSLKHIEMCSKLVMRRQLVQIQPSAPGVGTTHGSLTQRDRDPPFKRSDPGAIPGRPTNSARHAQIAVRPPCKRET